eukprot:COSAG02_NODE_1219_length_13812_cov_108.713629_11_plen_265_part_00
METRPRTKATYATHYSASPWRWPLLLPSVKHAVVTTATVLRYALSAPLQDPVDAGYTQLLCASSDDDDGDAPTGADYKDVGPCGLEPSETAADRLLHMLEADYHRCLEAERSTSTEASPQTTFSADAGREAPTGLDAGEDGADADCVAPIGSGGGDSRAPKEGSVIAGQSDSGDDASGRLFADVSAAPAASQDADIAAAAPTESTSPPAGVVQGGAFAQAVASSSVDDIQAAMAGISLPPAAWPAWAQDVSEKELLGRLRANAK